MNHFLRCIACQKKYPNNAIRYRCDCGEILEIEIECFGKLKNCVSKEIFDKRLGTFTFPYRSGVWRYQELLPHISQEHIITKPEGNTSLYTVGKNSGQKKICQYGGIDTLYLKHEGENPTGSFKDRGMTVGISKAKELKVSAVACASTGNTASSLASYAAFAGLPCFVFLPKGKISPSKLVQSTAYGGITIQIDGDFDVVMHLVEDVCNNHNIYLLNSINPYRVEGQKTILFELLQQLGWHIPDWIVLPGGNLGNTSAVGKALFELKIFGIIKKLPRIAVIQPEGANPFYQSFISGFKKRITVQAETVATAIRIGNPVSFLKAKKVIQETNGVVEKASDQEILDAKAVIDAGGIGCEPASAITLAGIKKLRKKNIIKQSDIVVGILTGHILKDPDTTMQYHTEKLQGIKSHYKNKIIEVNKKEVHKIIASYLT